MQPFSLKADEFSTVRHLRVEFKNNDKNVRQKQLKQGIN